VSDRQDHIRSTWYRPSNVAQAATASLLVALTRSVDPWLRRTSPECGCGRRHLPNCGRTIVDELSKVAWTLTHDKLFSRCRRVFAAHRHHTVDHFIITVALVAVDTQEASFASMPSAETREETGPAGWVSGSVLCLSLVAHEVERCRRSPKGMLDVSSSSFRITHWCRWKRGEAVDLLLAGCIWDRCTSTATGNKFRIAIHLGHQSCGRKRPEERLGCLIVWCRYTGSRAHLSVSCWPDSSDGQALGPIHSCSWFVGHLYREMSRRFVRDAGAGRRGRQGTRQWMRLV
jgi:hypothetical protein